MPIIFNLVSSILLASGFFFIGYLCIKILKIEKIIKKISSPIFQCCLFGIIIFLVLLYPFFFLGLIKNHSFKYLSLFVVFLGFYNFIFFSKKIFYFGKITINKICQFNINNFYILFLLLYFFLSLAPITSGDALGYHGAAAKYILANGTFPKEIFDLNLVLAGVGEFLNAFALSINAYQFTSLIHFIGLISMFGIFAKLLEDHSVDPKNKQIFFLLILSCPVIIFLVSTSKPQLFYTALIIFCYSCLIHIQKFKKKFEISIIFIISLIFCSIAYNAKTSFAISFFLIVINYFFLIKNKSKFYLVILTSSLISIFLIVPHFIWKEHIFNYPFYNFFFNPLPLNIPGFTFKLDNINNHDSTGFPFSLFIPLAFSDLTTFLGFGCFYLFFLLINKFPNKKIFLFNIFFFLVLMTLFGQKTPRFYLEIYLFIILLCITIFHAIKNNYFFKSLKFLIYFQSIFVFFILTYGTLTLFPGSLGNDWNKKVLSNYANGYNLYDWANSVLPSNSKIITNHRSTYFSNNLVFFLDFVYFIDSNNAHHKNYWLLKLKQQNPNFILFHGKSNNFNYGIYDFKNCTKELYSFKKDVGFNETRNPFNKSKETYNAYIYKFNSLKLPDCVRIKIK
jgi:hypothetical protein